MYSIFINGQLYRSMASKPEFPLSSNVKLKMGDDYYVLEKVVHCVSPELNLLEIQVYLRKQDLFYENTAYLG